MCIAFFFINPDCKPNGWLFVLAFNRDEFLRRPTSKVGWQNRVLAGRDETPGKAGGTWLAVSDTGKVAFLTNVYTGQPAQGAGRGFLVMDFVQSQTPPATYASSLASSQADYSPFNLCAFQIDPLTRKIQSSYCCKASKELGSSGWSPTMDGDFHGLGNHPLRSPYRKTEHGVGLFKAILAECGGMEQREQLLAGCFNLLGDRTSHYPDPQMEKQGQRSTFKQFHELLSSIFVDIPDVSYGTRQQTVVLIDYELNVTLVERSRAGDSPGDWHEARHDFTLKQ